MVIECPSCHTKFAVDAQQLADIESPRFHCSRCNHFFELGHDDEEEAKATADSTDTPTLEDSREETRAEEYSLDESAPDIGDVSATPNPVEQLELIPDSSNQPTSARRMDITRKLSSDEIEQVLVDRPEEAQVLADWPDDDSSSVYEADMSDVRYSTRPDVPRGSGSHEAVDSSHWIDEDPEPHPSPDEHPDEGLSSKRQVTRVVTDELELNELRAQEAEIAAERRAQEQAVLEEDEAASAVDSFQVDDALPGEDESELLSESSDTPAEDTPGLRYQMTAVTEIESMYSQEDDFSIAKQEQPPEDELVDFDRELPEHEEAKDVPVGSPLHEGLDELPQVPTVAPGLTPEAESPLFDEEPNSDFSQSTDLDTTYDSFQDGSIPTELPEEFDQEEPVDEPIHLGARGDSSRMGGWTGVFVVCLFPLLLAVGFWHWSGNLEKSPTSITRLFHLQPEGLPKLPPPDVVLVDLQSRLVTLDDGNKVVEIRGDVLNSSVSTFSNLKVEGRLYSPGNEEVSKLIVDYDNGLRNAKLESLPIASIESLQSKRGAGSNTLRPNNRAPFRIVFTELQGKEALASARIYSVEG